MSFNTFTGNNWRASGGINRRKFGNFVNSDQVSTGTLNVQNNFGFDKTKIPLTGNLAAVDSNLLYQLENNSDNLNSSSIIYYPLNSFTTNSSGQLTNESSSSTVPHPIINKTTNTNVYTAPSTNTNLTFIDQSGNESPYSFNSNYPGLITPQNAIQFRNNSYTLELNKQFNTQNVYSNQNYEISAALNFTCKFYIYYDGINLPEPFNILAFDTLDQEALVNNNISNGSVQSTTGISYESLYISIPNANGNNTGSIYFTALNQNNGLSIYEEFDISGYYNKWCTLEFSLGGTSMVCYINDKLILDQPYLTNATWVPNTKFYINNGPYFPLNDSSTNTVIGTISNTKYNTSPSLPIASLLAYKIGNFTIGSQSNENSLKSAIDEIVSEEYNPNLPNVTDKYVNYIIGGGTNYLAQPLTLNTGLTNNGFTNNIGLINNFGSSQFYGTSTFHGDVIFDSSLTLIVDSSDNVSNLNIVTLSPAVGTGNGSFTISNTAFANNIDNPSMLVYNSTNGGQVKQQSGGGWSTTGLIFSISGENVSIGETFGSNNGLAVNGSVDISGDLTGTDVQVTDYVTAGTYITAGTDITAYGNIVGTDISANGSITAGTTITAGTDITATSGSITAGTTVTAGTGITASTGNIVATSGYITAGTDITAYGNIVCTDISANGSITAGTTITAGTSFTALSDVSLKENICNLEHSLENITKLRGIKHTRNDLPDKEKVYIGFIAQELEEIYPELVYTSEINGIKSVSYSNITPILVEAVKELKIIASKQQKIIDKLLSNLDISLNEM